MAIDRATGKTVWERVAREQEPHEASHTDNGTWASSSAITDGERVYAYFESFGLYAYDMNGKLIWEKDLGDKRMRNEFGEGSTPALHGNTLVVVWDHLNGDGSFIVALDKRDGKELWRVTRDEIDTWATPLILEVNGRAQAIVPAMERIRSYDLATGAIVWEGDGLTMNAIPSPVHEDGLVVLMSGFRGNDLRVVRVAEAKGNIDGTSAVALVVRSRHAVRAVADSRRRRPLLPEDELGDSVGVRREDRQAALPEPAARRRAERLRVASRPPSGRIYFPGREGTTVVIKAGPTFETLATNVLDDAFDASPALVDNDDLPARAKASLRDRQCRSDRCDGTTGPRNHWRVSSFWFRTREELEDDERQRVPGPSTRRPVVRHLSLTPSAGSRAPCPAPAAARTKPT